MELAAKIASDANISKAAAAKSIDSLIGGITASLIRGDKVTFVGFGTFSVIQRKAKQGRNPQTGAPINIPARKAAKFKPGAKLTKAVR